MTSPPNPPIGPAKWPPQSRAVTPRAPSLQRCSARVKWGRSILDSISFTPRKAALICPRDIREVLLPWCEEFAIQGCDVDCRDGGVGGGGGVSSQELVGGLGGLLAVLLPFCPCILILHSWIASVASPECSIPELYISYMFYSKLTADPSV